MSHQEFELTAYCGLYCGDCIRYNSKAVDLAGELWHELRRSQFNKYAEVKSKSVKELEYYDECCRVLETIAELKCTSPCRLGGDGCVPSCKIKKCIKSNGKQGCWPCPKMEKCTKLDFLKPFHGEGPRENLRKIQKHGLSKWAKHRGKFYSWSR